MKFKLKGSRFDTTEEIRSESQRVLDTLTEKDLQVAFQNGGDGGTSFYMREGATSRMTRSIGLMVSFTNFTASVQKILDTTLYR